MTDQEISITIISMAIVTIFPRIGSVIAIERLHMSERVHKWISGIPYAIFGAMILPSAFFSIPDNILASVVSALVCALLAFININTALCVLAAIFTAFFLGN